MTSITKSEAHSLGMLPYSKQFWPHERELFAKWLSDTLKHHPEARVVECSGGRKVIYVRQAPRYGTNRPDNPKALRGNYPKPCQIVGRA